MYNHFFNFTEQPFSIAPDPHFIYMSARHQEGLAHLLFGIETGGFVALTGEVGTGKTTLCQCLLQQLPERIDMALILNPRLNAVELLGSICDELGIAYDRDRQTLKHLVDALNHHLLEAHAEGRRTVLMIDEAQNLSFDVLEQIRLLTNLETTKTKLLQIILVGQPELKEMLGRPELRQLNQRITARYHLLPLSLDDTRAYIRHRLALCGGNPGIFAENAIRKIHILSAGIPRVINIVCDRALLGAYATGKRMITPAIVAKAADETLNRNIERGSKTTVALLVIAGVCLAAAGLYFRAPGRMAEWRAYVDDSALVSAKPAQPPADEPGPSVLSEAAESLQVSFDAYIDSPARTLPSALAELLEAWGKPPATVGEIDCKGIEAIGLRCLSSRAQWHDILFLNSAVIMEFPLTDGGKHYSLLTGVQNGFPVFQNDPALIFPLKSVLSRWEGRYWLLMQPPVPSAVLDHIYPNQQSDAVLWLRNRLALIDGQDSNSRQPRFFDEALKARVQAFQRSQHLIDDGLVGPNTIERLNQYNLSLVPPKLKITD